MLTKLTALAAVVCLCSCTHRHASYAIRDFPDSLQPLLTRAINTGIVDTNNSAIRFLASHTTDTDIVRISQAEIPILRAIALNQMVQRPGFNHRDVMITHLDDTAAIPLSRGHRWQLYPFVSDYMIEVASWINEPARDSLADEILLHHDYLQSAYTALRFMPSLPKYYDHIKKMVLRDREYPGQIEFAVLALAKYRRKDDIPLIKSILWNNERFFSSQSFELMQNYPDTSYLKVLENYYAEWFYFTLRRDRFAALAVNYIDALAGYKNDACAKILKAIMDRKSFLECTVEEDYIIWQAKIAIWQNPCPPYAALRRQIAPEILEEDRRDSIRQLNAIKEQKADSIRYKADTLHSKAVIEDVTIDTSAEPVRWW